MEKNMEITIMGYLGTNYYKDPLLHSKLTQKPEAGRTLVHSAGKFFRIGLLGIFNYGYYFLSPES